MNYTFRDCSSKVNITDWVTLALISNIANYLKYNYFLDCDGIDNVTLRLWKFSDFCSRHTVGVAGDDIMFHILVLICHPLCTTSLPNPCIPILLHFNSAWWRAHCKDPHIQWWQRLIIQKFRSTLPVASVLRCVGREVFTVTNTDGNDNELSYLKELIWLGIMIWQCQVRGMKDLSQKKNNRNNEIIWNMNMICIVTRNRNVVMLMKLTTSSDENFIKITTFLFPCLIHNVFKCTFITFQHWKLYNAALWFMKSDLYIS